MAEQAAMFDILRALHSSRPTLRALPLAVGVLLLAGLVVLPAVSTGSAGGDGSSTAAEGATARIVGGERRNPVRRAVRHAKQSPRATRRAAKAVKRVAKPTRRSVRPVRKAVKHPKPAKAAKRSVKPAARPAPTSALPNDPLWRDSWALAKANATTAWQLSTGRAETVVAILDTGADLGHPDLEGSFVPGYDVVNHDGDPSDDHGHGTMVAGVIAARSNNGIGVTSACWRCSLMPVKVIGADGSGSAASVAEGIVWATEHGAQVINMSFVLSGDDPGVAQAIAAARERGIVVVAAAGNDGSANPTFPASYPGVVSVAGTDSADAPFSWSTHGSWVRLAAPGCSLTTTPGASYGDFCGTSSATGFVSGLAGLARSYAPGRSAAEIEQALASSATAVGGFVATGRVDAGRLLQSLGAPAAAEPAAPVAPAEPGEPDELP